MSFTPTPSLKPDLSNPRTSPAAPCVLGNGRCHQPRRSIGTRLQHGVQRRLHRRLHPCSREEILHSTPTILSVSFESTIQWHSEGTSTIFSSKRGIAKEAEI